MALFAVPLVARSAGWDAALPAFCAPAALLVLIYLVLRLRHGARLKVCEKVLRTYPLEYRSWVTKKGTEWEYLGDVHTVRLSVRGQNGAPYPRALNASTVRRWPKGAEDGGAWFAGDLAFGGVMVVPGSNDMLFVQPADWAKFEQEREQADTRRRALAEQAGIAALLEREPRILVQADVRAWPQGRHAVPRHEDADQEGLRMSAEQYGPAQPVFEPRLFGGGSHVPLVAAWLQSDERLLGIVDVTLSDLIPRVPRALRTGKQWSGTLGAAQGAVDAAASAADAVEFLDFGIARRLRRAMRGAGLTGGWQSIAGQFVLAVRTGPDNPGTYDNQRVLMAFTDRRVLLMCTVSTKKVPLFGKVPPGIKLREARCLGEFPPGQLQRVVIRHTSLSERVDLHFADGSLAAVEANKEQARALEQLSRGIVPPPRT